MEIKGGKIIGKSITELLRTCIGGIIGSSLFDAFDRCLADLPRCNEVGLTDGEGYNVGHCFEKVEELSYTRGLNIRTLF